MVKKILQGTMKKQKFFIKKIGLPETKKKSYTRTKAVLFALFGLIILLVIISACYGLYTFFTTYGLRSPIILQSPIYRIKPNVLIIPIGKKSAEAVFDVGAIADRIYQLESSSGKNDGCRKLGLYNGYGFRQNQFEWKCYSSAEQVRNLVIDWLETNIKDGNIEKALCLYNRGIDQTQCSYAIKYNSL